MDNVGEISFTLKVFYVSGIYVARNIPYLDANVPSVPLISPQTVNVKR